MGETHAHRLARLIALGAPLALLGGAYLSQYGFGLYPCEMCWWQRYPHFAALALAIMATLRPPAQALVWLATLAIAVSGAIGAFHAGVEYGWWEGVTACTIVARPGGGDPLAAILDAPLVRCDQAQWALWGISLAGWNFLFSGAAAAAIVVLLTRDKGKRP